MTPTVAVIVRFEVGSNRILDTITALGLTLRQAALIIGISERQLSRSIKGPFAPRLALALQIAAGLQTTVEQLFPAKVHRTRVSIPVA